MAGTNRRDWEELNITREEVENLKEALKKDEFRKLLADYAEEITSQENRKKYQEEIIQLEAERGVDCTFVNPEPGFVVKTSVDGKKKAFVNICKNSAIAEPWSKPVIQDNSKGLSWSIPFSQAPGREDQDKKRNRCVVYDVVFHPNTLHLAERNPQFKKLVVDTALSAIEDSYNVKLDKKNLKYPKLKFKGIPVATVIRKRSKKQPILTEEEIEFQKNMKYPTPPPVDDEKKPIVRNFDNRSEDKGKYTIPKYVIKHRTGIDLQEFTYDRNCKINTAIPKELVIEVNLPLLNSTKEVTLDVMEKSVHLICEKPAKYKLDIQLPYSVNEEKGNAKFDKDNRLLIISLPVIKASKTVADLMREDSGVESDFNDRYTSCDDSSPVGSVNCNGESESSPNVFQCEVINNDDSEKTSEQERETSKPFRTSFLEQDKQYILPSYKCNIDDSNLCFVLNVKNVDPSSLLKQMQGPNACHVKFLSLGAGFFPVFYAFLVKFQDNCIIKDVATDVWDNNVTIQFEMEDCSFSDYYVGVDDDSLVLKELNDVVQIERKLKNMQMNCNEEELDEDDDPVADENVSITVESADANEVAIKISQKEEKSDSYPVSQENGCVKSKPTEDKKSRTFSESSTDDVTFSPVTTKSILKNRICRSLSESNAEDYALGSSIEASEGSDLCIPEGSEETHSVKKTVRFNDRIRKQIFRANSSILGQKKKNQKRSRNKRKVAERRASESENSECEEKEKENRTRKKTPLIEEMEEKSKEDNCDIVEAVISEENESEIRNEVRFMAKKDDKIFEFKSDLIFDLDL
ncbi:UNVERIFIED_CONTAM: hypothetical protein PYX00_005129 [Menopon gallinae]|uniref:Protein kintoun n=1 Tax=Menopon gallinae TaxID=328185 RepID=A0AAW2HPZ1_9NEOP